MPSAPNIFVPEDQEAYDNGEIAAAGSYHYEFQYNRTAVRVSIPNYLIGTLERGGATTEQIQALIGKVVLKAARDAKSKAVR